MMSIKIEVQKGDNSWRQEDPAINTFRPVMDKLEQMDPSREFFTSWERQDPPALWTGGIDVSQYARKEHSVLEICKLGKLMDQLLLHPNWERQGPIWQLMSIGFAEKAMEQQINQGKDSIEVSYYFRADDKNSIARVTEIPAIIRAAKQRLGEDVGISIVFIPLINDQSKSRQEMRPLIPGTAISIDTNDWIKDLESGVSPLTCGLRAIQELTTKMLDVQSQYQSQVGHLEEFLDANAFSIKDHIRRNVL